MAGQAGVGECEGEIAWFKLATPGLSIGLILPKESKCQTGVESEVCSPPKVEARLGNSHGCALAELAVAGELACCRLR